MTADAIADDATLARGVASGDGACLAAIYDRYGGPLLGFCQNMLRRPADAEDCLQDVFVIAATRLGDLREPALLRSWLYSVARNECLARLDRRNREFLMDDVPDRATGDSADSDQPGGPGGPGGAGGVALDDDLAALLHDMEGGLSDRDRLLLELADRQELAGDELAAALGVPRATAYTLVGRARATARTSLGALLVARTGRDECPELDQLLTGWDGQLTTLSRKRIARHIEKCSICTEQRDRVATPLALLGEGRAFAAELVALRRRILAAAMEAMVGLPDLGGSGHGNWGGGWPPSDPEFGRPGRRRWLVPLAVLTVLLLVGGGAVIAATTDLNDPQGGGAPAAVVAPATTTSESTTAPLSPLSVPASVSTSDVSVVAAPPSPSSVTSAVTSTAAKTTNAPSSGIAATTITAPTSASSPDTPTTSSSSSPSTPVTWTVSVNASNGAATVSIDGTQAKSCRSMTCTYTVEDGGSIDVTAIAGSFTAPKSCVESRTCSLTVTADTKIVIKTQVGIVSDQLQ